MEELSKLKETYRSQCETFVAEIRKLDGNIIENSERLQLRCNKLDNATEQQRMKINLHDSNIGEIYNRMKIAEEEI